MLSLVQDSAMTVFICVWKEVEWKEMGWNMQKPNAHVEDKFLEKMIHGVGDARALN